MSDCDECQRQIRQLKNQIAVQAETIRALRDKTKAPHPYAWRVGRSVGRTIYDSSDSLIGMMDTTDLAARVVEDHNARLKLRYGS